MAEALLIAAFDCVEHILVGGCRSFSQEHAELLEEDVQACIGLLRLVACSAGTVMPCEKPTAEVELVKS